MADAELVVSDAVLGAILTEAPLVYLDGQAYLRPLDTRVVIESDSPFVAFPTCALVVSDVGMEVTTEGTHVGVSPTSVELADSVLAMGAGEAHVSAGPLPGGLSLQDNGDGTAFIYGIPRVKTSGIYRFTLEADNGAYPAVEQEFELTIVPREAVS